MTRINPLESELMIPEELQQRFWEEDGIFGDFSFWQENFLEEGFIPEGKMGEPLGERVISAISPLSTEIFSQSLSASFQELLNPEIQSLGVEKATEVYPWASLVNESHGETPQLSLFENEEIFSQPISYEGTNLGESFQNNGNYQVFEGGESEEKTVHIHNEIPSVNIAFTGAIEKDVDVGDLMNRIQRRIREEMESNADFAYSF